MRRQDFSFDLPEELIAQSPLAERSASRLLVLDGATGALADRGIKPVRSYVGEYCTSLEMAGMSLTLVRLDDELEDLLSAPAEVAARVF